ncbi:hypothetical protein OIU34_24830 [Pararhizobium sp. BT-229]|uniref:hypothetical protein n=1 Tax=Pararhizobium sp. BT-229 TaxID=2986923 RepID=UPI0021F70F90|nr:hypothetical protein [Pararhizobium sp. BT-229]MCV9965111.1 hypothetical protein [Pararhizobium sp. BT-229]
MTNAICVRCGEVKWGAFTRCRSCGWQPDSELDVAYSLALSDHYLSEEEMEKYAKSVKSGSSLHMSQEDETYFLQIVRNQRAVELIKRARGVKRKANRSDESDQDSSRGDSDPD